jgi:hypothetical protein
MAMDSPVNFYRFETYGPFELPLIDANDVDFAKLPVFWEKIESEYPGLPEAMGCYVFAIERQFSLLPWYVGKTEKKSFKFESVQFHKTNHYHEALKKAEGKRALLFLLPRLTAGGKFRKVWKGGSSSVARLEGMLIEAALKRNPLLQNRNLLKHLTQTVVPGFCNDGAGDRSEAATLLAQTLGTTKLGATASLISTLAADSIEALEAKHGPDFWKENRMEIIFSREGSDYELILQPHLEESDDQSADEDVAINV